MKLFAIVRALELRRRRPEVFAGPYEPVPAGRRACVFLRGEADVLVAVPTWFMAREAAVSLPDYAGGRWRDVYTGVEHRLDGRFPLGQIVTLYPFAVLERVG
jgi:maltooligosyltrehalose synthase